MVGPGHTHNSCCSPGNLTDHSKSTNNAIVTTQPREHWRAQFNHNPREWSNTIYIHSQPPFSDSTCSGQNVPAIPPGLNRHGRFLPGWWRGVAKVMSAMPTMTSTGPGGKALLLKATSNLRHQHTQTLHMGDWARPRVKLRLTFFCKPH